jgi:quinol monooxygenase YgiN
MTMFGLIGKMTAVAGQRDALIAILLEGIKSMPGCLSYIVAKDPRDESAIWITEVWDSKESHAASLSLPALRQAIARGKPLIAAFGDIVTTEPAGGHRVTSGGARGIRFQLPVITSKSCGAGYSVGAVDEFGGSGNSVVRRQPHHGAKDAVRPE